MVSHAKLALICPDEVDSHSTSTCSSVGIKMLNGLFRLGKANWFDISSWFAMDSTSKPAIQASMGNVWCTTMTRSARTWSLVQFQQGDRKLLFWAFVPSSVGNLLISAYCAAMMCRFEGVGHNQSPSDIEVGIGVLGVILTKHGGWTSINSRSHGWTIQWSAGW